MFNSQQTTLKVALYIRVSTDEQVERYGIPLQIDSLKSLIKSRPKLEGGLDSMVLAGVDDQYIYIDEGVSGTIPLDERPAFARMKEDIILAPEGEQPFDIVLVYKIDRFARRLKILLEVIEFFDENNIKFISANESIDTSTPFGKAMLGIIGVIAELEIETIKMRTTAGRQQALDSGVVLGANAPYGYGKDENKRYKILKNEAQVVRQIFEMFVDEDLSFNQIAQKLIDLKIPSPDMSAIKSGKRKGNSRKKTPVNFWYANRIAKILRDEIYTGKIWGNKIKNGKLLPKSEWTLSSKSAPTIIDSYTFERASKKLLKSKHVQKTAKDGHVYLLSGLLKCDCCRIKLDDERVGWCGNRKQVKNGFQYYYRCVRRDKGKTPIKCNSLPLNASEIENYVVNYSRELLKSPVAVFNYQLKKQSQINTIVQLNKKEEQLLNLIDGIPARKRRLQEQHVENIIDTKTLKSETEKLNTDLKRYQKNLEEIRKNLSMSSLSKNYIDVLDLFTEKYKPMLKNTFNDRNSLYTILHQLIEEIVIYTRPVTKEDTIAGQKRENQEIPNRIHIKLKLPQDIFSQIHTGGSLQKSLSGAQERT